MRDILVVPNDVEIHDTHYMAFEPCLHLECNKCFLSVKNNAAELKYGCTEDVHEINDSRNTHI